MIHRSRAPAQPGRVPDGPRHIVLRERHRLVERTSKCELRGQRRRKRAPGTVSVPAGDPFGLVLREDLSVVDQIDNPIGAEVTAGDDDVHRAELKEATGGFPAILLSSNRDSGKNFGLRDVWRYHVGAL